MSKTLWVSIKIDGTVNNIPDNMVQSYKYDVVYNGIDTNIWQYNISNSWTFHTVGGATYDSGIYKYSFDSASWVAPQNPHELLASDGDAKWHIISVPDSFVIPWYDDSTGLVGGYKYANSTEKSISLSNAHWNFTTSIVAGLDFGSFKADTSQSLPQIFGNAASALGYPGVAAAITNSSALYTSLTSVQSGALDLIKTGLAGASDPNFNAANYDAQVNAFLSGAQQTFLNTASHTVLVPNNPVADQAAHVILGSLGEVASGTLPINGSAQVSLQLNVAGAAFITVGAELSGGVDVVFASNNGQSITATPYQSLAGGQSIGAQSYFLIGGAGNDQLVAGGVKDYLDGGSGNNILVVGASGTDFLDGGLGGQNTISFANSVAGAQSTGHVGETFNLTLSSAQHVDAGTTITASNFTNIVGSSFGDTLTGNGVGNAINGGLGNDWIIGDGGADTLTGGGGANVFLDSYANFNGDTITDLSLGDQVIVANATAGGFGFSRLGAALSIGNGSTITLQGSPVGHLITTPLASGGVSLTLAQHEAGLSDFNGDGHSDFLWRNASGTISEWNVTGNTVANQESPNSYVAAIDPSWTVQGTLDFNGDGASDVIWRQASSGVVSIWDSTGSGFASNSYVAAVDPGYAIAGLGDFNGDGKDDLIWRNTTTGVFTEWQSTGSGFTPNTYVNGSVDPTWKIAGIGDFNGDGKADLLWRNGTSGVVAEWLSTGTGFTPNTYVNNSVDSSWKVAAVGDFNGDGKDDIVWRNVASGVISVWQSTGSAFTQNTYVNGSVDASWQLEGAFDFNDDGKSDLLWRSSSTGVFAVWQSTGSGFAQNVLVDGSVPASWSLQTYHYDIV